MLHGVFALEDTETENEAIKNGLCRIVWRCTYYSDIETEMQHIIGICIRITERKTDANFHWVLSVHM